MKKKSQQLLREVLRQTQKSFRLEQNPAVFWSSALVLLAIALTPGRVQLPPFSDPGYCAHPPLPFFCFIPLTECHMRMRVLSVKSTFCLYLNQNIWLFWDPISSLLLLQLAWETVCNWCNFSARTCKLCSAANSCGHSSLWRIIHSHVLFLSYMILFPHDNVSVSTAVYIGRAYWEEALESAAASCNRRNVITWSASTYSDLVSEG